MKLYSKSVFLLGLLSSSVIASEYLSPVENIQVFFTESSTLSIQNFSDERVEIDLYGETFNLAPASGLQFECQGYESLELQVKNINHDFFEIPCQSQVVIAESFTNEVAQGE